MRVRPVYVGSLDIETLSTKPNSYILSLSHAIFDIYSLKLVAQFDSIIGPNDASQEGRLKDVNTINWWRGSAPNSPDEYARELAHSGSGSLYQTIREYDAFMRGFKEEHRIDIGQMITTCRGPDFDPVILLNARQMLGLGYGQPFREFDSARMCDRALTIMKKEVPFSVVAPMCPNGEFHEHVSICDAIHEAYEGAVFYHELAKAFNDPYIPADDYLHEYWKAKEIGQMPA